jgi:hypothetical protein
LVSRLIDAPKKQAIVVGKPSFERRKAPLHFRYSRCFVTPKQIQIEVVSTATELARTRQRVALGMNTELFVSLDNLVLNPRALARMLTASCHRAVPFAIGSAIHSGILGMFHAAASLHASAIAVSFARVKFTISETWPFANRTRHMLGYFSS